MNPDLDYDIHFVEYGNEYIGNERYAIYQWQPGHTEIILSDQHKAMLGFCIQGEKAEDVCRAWIEEGRISVNFHEIKD